ncbi:uncharacterized protein LOC124955813 [Vespa velutina]|uniref:uncharacterized protein LOC124955813 n=1 Tax=Vespa velutina TaxID=202808 RepID=UPI001FB1C1D5|nr:uncharacterized protein LOC124955813 [Vespa velutina]
MNNECVCTRCYHPTNEFINIEAPYSEVSQEIGDTRISIKVSKRAEESSFNIDSNCADAYGKKCREGCTRMNIIPNEEPPPKAPDEKMFLLKSIRQITPNDDLKKALELEFKLPRNYIPLPTVVPPSPIIKIRRTDRGTGKKKHKKKKKK